MTRNKNKFPVPRAADTTASGGNALLIVLLTIAVLSLVAGNLMWSASARYHVTYQSSSWQEALVAAEAGVDVAMGELRNHVVNHTPAFSGASWVSGNNNAVYAPGNPNVRSLLGGAIDPLRLPASFNNHVNPDLAIFPDNGHALPLTALPSRGGEGNTPLAYRVYVDVPDSDDVTTQATPPVPAEQTLAQPPPGTKPEDLAVKFINQPDDGVSDKDTHDRPVNMSRWWWRIRAVGYAGVSGPARPSPDARDGFLRRFSFFADWRSGAIPWLPGQPVTASAPQVSRVVEVLAQPHTRTHYALLGDKGIDLRGQNVRVDSYDSTKGDYGALVGIPLVSSSNGTYTAPGSALDPNGSINPGVGRNIGWLGNIATNGQLINANGAVVQGSAMTNNGTVSDAENVTGNEDPNFYQDLLPIKAQGWADLPSEPTLTQGKTFKVTSTDPRHPDRIRLNGINLSDSNVVKLTAPEPPAGGLISPNAFVKVYVEGDILTNGTGAVRLDPTISAIFYVEGRVSLTGAGIENTSKKPTQLVINGVQPADGTAGGDAHSITISPYGTQTATPPKGGKGKGKKSPPPLPPTPLVQNGDFTGIIYAPQHDLYISGSGTANGGVVSFYDFAGAFVANRVTVSVDTAIHFDESLRTAGQLGGYKLVNWFEDTATSVAR